MKTRIAVFVGTRPEAIKMLPVINELRICPEFDVSLVSTGQHREMVEDFFRSFNITIDKNFNIMKKGQTLSEITAKVMSASSAFFQECPQDLVLVHGDTTTALTAALAAFYQGIPVGHVEAGLRTFDLNSPFPEELNRQLIDKISNWAFAPTEKNRNYLLQEGVDSQQIIVTGNTVVDAVSMITANFKKSNWRPQAMDMFPEDIRAKVLCGRYFFVTCHRRENHDLLDQIAEGLNRVAAENPEYVFVWPVHPNPKVSSYIKKYFKNHTQFCLTEPLDYRTCVWFLSHCKLVITDSGGIQEEAIAVRRPCVILRENTERPEVVDSGWGKLVGTNPQKINLGVEHFRKSPMTHLLKNPYGDGKASLRIRRHLQTHFQSTVQQLDQFVN